MKTLQQKQNRNTPKENMMDSNSPKSNRQPHLDNHYNVDNTTNNLNRNNPVEADHSTSPTRSDSTTPSLRTRERIGYDIYNPEHKKHFLLSKKTSDFQRARQFLLQNISARSGSGSGSGSEASKTALNTVTNCTLPGLFPGRAFITASVLTQADFTSGRGHHRALLADHAFRSTILNVLRRDNGYVSAVESTPFTSNLFPNFGYYRVQWCVALGEEESDDEQDNRTDAPAKRHAHIATSTSSTDTDTATTRPKATAKSTGEEQVEASVRALHDLFTPKATIRPFERSTFLISKSSLVSNIESKLQESGSWLSVLRGISLRPPTWFETHRADYQTIKDIAETDVLGTVQRLSFEDVSEWFSRHLSGSTGSNFYLRPQINIGIVEPVAGDSSSRSENEVTPASLASPNGRQGNARQAESAAAFKAGERVIDNADSTSGSQRHSSTNQGGTTTSSTNDVNSQEQNQGQHARQCLW